MGVAISKDDLYKEIKDKLGLVPEWVQQMPHEVLPGFWALMRDFHLAETKIPNKYKELIGLAVAGATRCRYCQLFHTEAARLFGASDEEIVEASCMSGFTMMASTYVNSLGLDYDKFAQETRQIVSYVRAQKGQQPQARPGTQPRA